MPVPVYERILQLLEAEGIKTLFGVPDPNFVHMFQEADRRGWQVISPHHELAVGFGCHGDYVEHEEDIGPAIARAYASGKTAVVHVASALLSRRLWRPLGRYG